MEYVFMPLPIEFNDKTGETIYANLFDAIDKQKAFNPTTNNFITLTDDNKSDVSIILSEDDTRTGHYSNIINDVSNIPETLDGNFYLIEVYRATGTSFDRSTDKLVGTLAFYWDGEKEVNICGCEAETSGGSSITPAEIWGFEERSLTQDLKSPDIHIDIESPDSCEDFSKNIEDKLEIINNLLLEIRSNQSVKTRVSPNTQKPRINRGTGGASDIRIT